MKIDQDNANQSGVKEISFDDKILKLGDNKKDFWLMGSKCKRCGTYYFPQRTFCPKCFEENTLEEAPLSKRGNLYTFTVVRRASLVPEGFPVPYAYGYLDLPEGVRVLSMLEGDPESLSLDIDVELSLREVGKDKAGNKIMGHTFVPVN